MTYEKRFVTVNLRDYISPRLDRARAASDSRMKRKHARARHAIYIESLYERAHVAQHNDHRISPIYLANAFVYIHIYMYVSFIYIYIYTHVSIPYLPQSTLQVRAKGRCLSYPRLHIYVLQRETLFSTNIRVCVCIYDRLIFTAKNHDVGEMCEKRSILRCVYNESLSIV